MGQLVARSRAFRNVVSIEIIWFVEPGESDFRDWEGVVRDAIASAEPPAWPGLATITETEELTPPEPPVGADGEPSHPGTFGDPVAVLDVAVQETRTMKEEPLAASDTRGMAGSALGIDTAHDAVQKAWNLANDDPETVYLWERVEGGPAGLLCPACFTLDAHAKNVSIVWRPVVE